MNIFESRIKEISFPMTNGGLDKISVILGLIAVAFSAGAAIAIAGCSSNDFFSSCVCSA